MISLDLCPMENLRLPPLLAQQEATYQVFQNGNLVLNILKIIFYNKKFEREGRRIGPARKLLGDERRCRPREIGLGVRKSDS